jgi:hypothetical protein
VGRYYETFNPPFFLDLSYRFDAIKANPYGYDRPSTDILVDLKRGLRLLEPIKTPNLRIKVHSQEITLSGSVPTTRVAMFIKAVATNILGVRNVVDLLTVERAGAYAKDRPLRRTPRINAGNPKPVPQKIDLIIDSK